MSDDWEDMLDSDNSIEVVKEGDNSEFQAEQKIETAVTEKVDITSKVKT